jgi:hypothetical protein
MSRLIASCTMRVPNIRRVYIVLSAVLSQVPDSRPKLI